MRAIREFVSRRTALLPLALLSVLALAAAAPQAQAPFVEPLEDAFGVRVEFSQLNWRGEGDRPGIPQSRVGTARFSFGPEAAALVTGDGAFVNLVTAVPGGTRSWAVRNLFVRYPSPEHMAGSHPGVQFSLTTPNGLRVSSLSYSLTLTPTPLTTPPAGSMTAAAVALQDYHTGGFNGGGSGLTLRPLTIGPWIGPALLPGGPTVTTNVPADGIPAVDEDTNGCAPGSVARSIAYMTGDENVQDIYEDLYEDMETTEDGTEVDNMVSGKAAYAEANGLDITTNLNEDGLGSIKEAMDTLANGGDVEIIIYWEGGGGHAAMVTSITDNGDGTYTITYVDDPNQGDGQAENEEHTITVNADGSFDGGTVGGFLTETLN